MRTSGSEEIVEKWRFVNLSGTSIVLSGNANPSFTAKVLRGARDDVALLYGEVTELRQKLARAEGELAGIRAVTVR